MTRTLGLQIVATRDFHNPDPAVLNQYGERTENSTDVRERYPDVESGASPAGIVRTPVFAPADFFFVVKRVEVIPGVYASSVPALVTGGQIAPGGTDVGHQVPLNQIEFLPVYYASVSL